MKTILNITVLTITGLALCAGLLLAARLGASGARVDEQALAAANRLFEAGRFSESARILEQILAGGAEESAVYFNLGNAYYAQGDITGALENYQKAARLAPRDQDIRNNLELAKAQVEQTVSQANAGMLAGIALLTASWMSLNESAILLLTLWFAICYLLFASRLIERPALRSGLRIAAVAGTILILLLGASLGSRLYLDHSPAEKADVPTVIAEI